MAKSNSPKKTAKIMPPEAALLDGLSLSEKMARGCVMSVDCPSREVMRHVTSRWGVLILIQLLGGTKRFSQLRREIGGVSERMLAQTLSQIEQDGLVTRTVHQTVPPHVDYALTDIGRDAATRVRELADWIEINIGAIMAGKEMAALDKVA